MKYDSILKSLRSDRTKSGHVHFNKQFVSIEAVNVLPVDNSIKLKIMADKSIVEVFVID